MRSSQRFISVFVLVLLFFVSGFSFPNLVQSDTIITDEVDADFFVDRYGPVVKDVQVIKKDGSFDHVHSNQSDSVTLSFGNTVVKVKGHSDASPVRLLSEVPEKVIPGQRYTIYAYQNIVSYGTDNVFCMVPQGKSTITQKITAIYSDPQKLKSDYQYQRFTGQAIPMCFGDYLLVDNKGVGYFLPGSINVDGVNKIQEEIKSLVIPLDGYANIEEGGWQAHSIYITKNPRDRQVDKIVTDLAKEIQNTTHFDYFDPSEPITACHVISSSDRAYLKSIPSNEDIEKWCGKMDFWQTWGFSNRSYLEGGKYIVTISAFPPSKPLGRADMVEGITLSNVCGHGEKGDIVCDEGYISPRYNLSLLEGKITDEPELSSDSWTPKTWYLNILLQKDFHLYEAEYIEPKNGTSNTPKYIRTYTLQ